MNGLGVVESKEVDKIQSRLEELTRLHAGVGQALSDPKRILILYALNEHPHHVNDLAADLGLPQSTVSRHLHILRQESLVLTERTGTRVIYRLADRRIMQVLETTRRIMFDALERKTVVFGSHKTV